MTYALDKFEHAILELIGPGSQRERLINAYRYNLYHIDPEELPSEIRNEFISLHQELTLHGTDSGCGLVESTVYAMPEYVVAETMGKIIKMYTVLTNGKPV